VPDALLCDWRLWGSRLRRVPVVAGAAATRAVSALCERFGVSLRGEPSGPVPTARPYAPLDAGPDAGRDRGDETPGSNLDATPPSGSAPIAHGDRLAYRRGCRCLRCARAEALYRRALRDRSPQVDCGPARRHLVALAEHGVGLTQAAHLSGIPRSTLQDIRNGVRRSMPPALLAAVLDIPAQPALGALTKAWRTRRLVAWFLLEGFTKAEVARRLGQRTPHLQITSRCCTFRTAARVRALHRTVAEI
jgi:hypothetical protein